MSRYLDQFKSLAPSLQGNTLIQSVEELRKNGTITTEAEYWEAINELLAGLSVQEIKPLYKFIPFKEGMSSADHFNTLMNQILGDIRVLTSEAENITKVIVSHRGLFYEKVIPEFEDTFKRIEAQLEQIRTVSSPENSFEKIFYNNFKMNTQAISSDDEYFDLVMFDSSLGAPILISDFGSNDKVDGGLSFTKISEINEPIREIEVGSDSTATDYDVSIVGLNIYSLVSDQRLELIWAYVILKDEPIGTSKLVLRMKFNDFRAFNFFYIDKISDFPIFLQDVKFLGYSSTWESLTNYDFTPYSIQNRSRRDFKKITAREFEFHFTQDNFVEFAYNLSRGELSFDDLKITAPTRITSKMVADSLKEQVIDPSISSIINPANQEIPKFKNLIRYQFGFRQIGLGVINYSNLSYFVSAPYIVEQGIAFGLEVDQFTPTLSSAPDAPAGVIEYEIVRQDFSSDEKVYTTLTTAVLPVGSSSVTSEYLSFSASKRIFSLRFRAHDDAYQTTNAALVVLRDNVPLTFGIDWIFSNRADPLNWTDTTIESSQKKTQIQLLVSQTDSMIASGIYTANYIPAYLQQKDVKFLLDDENSYFLETGVLAWTLDRKRFSVEKVHLYLKIAFRGFVSQPQNVAKLNYYRLLFSTKDEDRY